MAHIVIDARRINSSTGHYMLRLVQHLEKIDSTNRYTVVVLEKEKDYYAPRAKNFAVHTTRADHYTLAEQTTLALLLYRLKPDLVHFTMPQQPLVWFGKRVTTIHDTTLIRYENIDGNKYVYKIQKAIFYALMRNVIRRSRYILSPSEYVSKDLDTWTGGRYTNKLLPIKIAGDPVEGTPKPVAELVGKQYLFWVGNAFPYKNVDKIVDAFALVKKTHRNLHLALAGKRDIFYQKIEEQVKQKKIADVHILGYISDEEKIWLFKNAQAYVVASLSEGFHMPLHEAMHAGCPVISSNATCLPEVAGDAAFYFDPNNITELADKIILVLKDKKFVQSLRRKGYAQVKKFSWESSAKQTLETYQKSLS